MVRATQRGEVIGFMVLTKYIAKTCIVPKMAAKNKSDAIKELTNLLFDKKKMKEGDAALDQVLSREVTESTGIGHGIAVPHARVAGTKQLACAVGRIPDGIDFMSIDRKPVYVIFLIVYPPAQQTTYLNFIATVSKLLHIPENMSAILKAADGEEMFDIIERASEVLNERQEHGGAPMESDPAIPGVQDAHADLILLARMQLYQEMIDGAKTGKAELKQRIDNIRKLVDPRLLRHYDRLMKAQPPALVPVEGDTCQGCFMKLPSKFAQQVKQDTKHVHTCSNCSRFIYVL